MLMRLSEKAVSRSGAWIETEKACENGTAGKVIIYAIKGKSIILDKQDVIEMLRTIDAMKRKLKMSLDNS